MGVDWTTDQQHAIECCKGSVLVSAAAGSGKTTVLVERVIRRLTDEDNPCSAEDLLIVTFTRAATAQTPFRGSDGQTSSPPVYAPAVCEDMHY